MRVVCNSLGEFLTELEMSEGRVLEKLVRISTSKNPVLDSPHQNPRDAVKTEIIVQATTIIQMKEGGEYLVDFSCSCGVDYSDASQTYEGTEKSESIKKIIKVKCEELGLKQGPGVIEI